MPVTDITPALDAKREAEDFIAMLTDLLETGQVHAQINEDGEYGLYPGE